MKVASVRKVMARFTRGFVVALHDIEPDKMEALMDTLAPIEPIPLSELVERRRQGRSTAGLCAITVDDGIARAVRGISQVCRRRAWPATFYLPTAILDTGEAMPFQWLRSVLPLLAGRRISLANEVLDFTGRNAARTLWTRLETLWHSAPIAAYQPFTMELVNAVAAMAGVPKESLRPPAMIPWEEVAGMSKDRLFSFESHGISHVALSTLSEDELILELKQSRDTIAEHTGQPCRHLAYPFGSRLSIGSLAPVVARRFYNSAATMDLGHVDAADPWMLPRIPLYQENSSLDALLKVAVKCGRYLPAATRFEQAESDAGGRGLPLRPGFPRIATPPASPSADTRPQSPVGSQR